MVCCIFLQSWYWQWSSSQFSLCTSSWSEDPSSQESTVFSNKRLWFLEFTLVVKKMWTGKSRCVCWCWFCLTYFYPRRYLTQWKLLRDCDQDPHGTPEDTTTVRRHEHRQEHENKWSYQHLSGRKHVPYREERQDRQAFRVTHTHTSFSRYPSSTLTPKGSCVRRPVYKHTSHNPLFPWSDTVSFHWTL